MLQAGKDVEAIRSRIRGLMPSLQTKEMKPLLTTRSQRVFTLTEKEAGSLGDRYIGTEHLLLGCALEVDQTLKGKLDLLGTSVMELRSVLDKEPRGEQAPSNRGKKLPPDPEEAVVDGSTAQKLRFAAQLCDTVKMELIQDQRFEHASKARDIAHWTRVLADEVDGKKTSS
jgi:ATP-dependent Clp protease ATP-binding subunit ClpA